MIAFIDDHRGAYGVEPICEVLPIAPSTYHLHAARRADPSRLPARAKCDASLMPEIARVFDENFQVYGVRKVWRQLQREGQEVARCTIERLMQTMGLQGVIRGKPVRTTISEKAAPCPLDHVNRRFKAPRPNALWVADFTYVATWAGFVYVAFVIDTYARRIVGWRVSRTARASCSMLSSRLFMIEDRCIRAGSCITVTEAANTSRSNTLSAWPKPGSSLPWAASATATTMPSPKRSMASTRPRSSIGAVPGGTSKLSRSRR
jgi:hypothetical protein